MKIRSQFLKKYNINVIDIEKMKIKGKKVVSLLSQFEFDSLVIVFDIDKSDFQKIKLLMAQNNAYLKLDNSGCQHIEPNIIIIDKNQLLLLEEIFNKQIDAYMYNKMPNIGINEYLEKTITEDTLYKSKIIDLYIDIWSSESNIRIVYTGDKYNDSFKKENLLKIF